MEMSYFQQFSSTFSVSALTDPDICQDYTVHAPCRQNIVIAIPWVIYQVMLRWEAE